MEHRPLGRTGVSVSKLCLGAMMFGAWGNPDHDESIRIIHAALDAGINFIDTADVYGQGESEEIVGKALAGGRRDDVVLATKFHNPMGEDPNRRGNSRRWIMRAVEDSLRRLDTDWIDLYQVHRPDPGTDIEETLAALSDLVHQGKVRYIGASTFPASADRRGAVGGARPAPAAVRHRAAAVLDPRARHRGRRAAHVRAARHGRHVLQPAGRRLAVGPLAQGHRPAVLLAREPAARALRPLAARQPAQARRRRGARAARRGGRASRSSSSRSRSCSTTPRSPRRSSGRAPWSSSRASSPPPTSSSTTAVLDRIDEIVPPGTTINPGRQLLRQPGARAGGAAALDRRALGADRRRALATGPVHAYRAAKAAPRPRLPRRCLRLEAGPTQRCASTAPRASEQQAHRSDRRISPRAARTMPGDRRTRLRARR